MSGYFRLCGPASSAARTRAEISQYLWFEMLDHVGLDPEGMAMDHFADRLVALAAVWQ